jgi:hypothetical protein
MRVSIRASILAAMGMLTTSDIGLGFEQGASFTLVPGTTMGLPFAYTGTPGVYFYSLGNYGTMSLPKDVSPNVGRGPASIKLDVGDEVPAILWTTPWKLFGASYAILFSEPMVSVKSYGEIPGLGWHTSDSGGLRNTVFAPINLSWHLGNGWNLGAGVNFSIPDGRTTGVNGLDSSGQPYWTIEPTLGFSYLHDGFDLSATLLYDIYTTNRYSDVTNGQALYLDLTATKRFGHFEIGPVAYMAVQTTRDRGGNPTEFLLTRGAVNSCEAEPYGIYNYCVRAAKAGVGGKIGYDFGSGEIAVIGSQSVLSHGSGGSDGWRIWTQFTLKLYGAGSVAPPLLAQVDPPIK